jgi:hypothetical protein
VIEDARSLPAGEPLRAKLCIVGAELDKQQRTV